MDLLQLARLDVIDEATHRNILTNKVRFAVGCNVVLDALCQICKGESKARERVNIVRRVEITRKKLQNHGQGSHH